MNAPNPLPPRGQPPRLPPTAIHGKTPPGIKTALLPASYGVWCALLLCWNPVQAAPESTNQSVPRLTIDLRDGSRVIGKSLEDILGFHSGTVGDMKLPWTGIRSIQYAGTNTGTARLTATNGDAITIQITTPSLHIETCFGKAELPVGLIQSVKVSTPANAGQWASSLVAYWKGDGDAKDSIGRSDGQGFGGLRYVPGPAGQAFQFNGGDAKVDFGNSAGNFGTNDFTIAYWMKTDSKNPHEAFLGKRAVCDSIISFWDILIAVTGNSPPGSISLSVDPGGSRAPFSLASSRPVNDGQWHHVAWVRQSAISGNVTYLVYIDGALDNSQACAEAWDLANSTSLVMGKSVCEGHDGCAPYSGAVAELQLFSQALSADEILAVFHAAKPEK